MENNNEQTQENPMVTIQDDSSHNKIISIGEWIGVMIIISIPLVNIIAVIIWASSSATNPTKKNFAIATLIIWAAAIVLFLLLGSGLTAFFGGLSN